MGDDKLHLWGISKREELEIEGEPVWVASPEYVILRKLDRQVTRPDLLG